MKIASKQTLNQLIMPYEQYVKHLLKKYGPVPFNYFTNESCKYVNKKNSRINEGLHIHHIFENKAIMLSKTNFALAKPFDFQLSKNLVYCDLFEHLILHIKIALGPQNPLDNKEILGFGGVINFISPELNDHFASWHFKQPWRAAESIKLNKYKSDYVFVMSDFIIEVLTASAKHIVRFLQLQSNLMGRKLTITDFVRSSAINAYGEDNVPKDFLDRFDDLTIEIAYRVFVGLSNEQNSGTKINKNFDFDDLKWIITGKK